MPHFSVQETSSTEPSETASVSRDGIIALGVVFGTFAVAMGAFVAYLIYREKKGKPSFGPQVRIQQENFNCGPQVQLWQSDTLIWYLKTMQLLILKVESSSPILAIHSFSCCENLVYIDTIAS